MRKLAALLLAAFILGIVGVVSAQDQSVQMTQDLRGPITYNTSTKAVTFPGAVTFDGSVTVTGGVTATEGVLSSSSSSGVGYSTGAGCAVTQVTSRTNGVTCSAVTGAITLISAAGSATPASFDVTNTAVAITDVIIVNQRSGSDLYEIHVTSVGAGAFTITFFTTGGTTTEQPVFNFAVIKGAAS